MDTGWRLRGKPELLFGRMFEDASMELAAFPPGCRVFAIASGGCTAITLANAGYRVTAVDLNPAQVEYVAQRISGAEPRRGKIDGFLNAGLRFAPWLGMSKADRERFCAMGDTTAQAAYWRNHLATARLGWMLRAIASPFALRHVYSKQILSSLPPRFDREVLRRLERGFAMYPNNENPFVRAYLLGDLSPVRFQGGTIELATAGAAEYLEGVPPQSFDAFTLSNIFDGAGPQYSERLLRAIAKASSPHAVTIIRRFAGPGSKDRAMIWGTLEVNHRGD